MRNRKHWSVISVLLFVLAAAPLAHAQNPPPPKPKGLDGFHVVLLAAHTDEKKGMPQLPSSVMKALRDASEFLPYKSYALVDEAFVRGRGGAPEQRVALRYPKLDYVATVAAGESSATGARIVTVTLTEVAPAISGGVELLSATFSASDGETVVVGTSRVRGSQQALVLLVTLVRSGAGGN
jgi:hypothetical protein